MVGIAAPEIGHRRLVFVELPPRASDGSAASMPQAEAAEPAAPSPADYAAKIRNGDVGGIAEARAIGDMAREITIHTREMDGVEERIYFGRDGQIIHGDDAELLLSRSRPGDWMFAEETVRDLYAVRDQLGKYQGEGEPPVLSVFDPRIPLEDVAAIGNAQRWLTQTLGINADRFELNELIEKIDARVHLSEQIVARLPQQVLPEAAAPEPQPVVAPAASVLTVTLTEEGASGPVIDPFAGLAPITVPAREEPALLAPEVMPAPVREDQPEVPPLPPTPTQIGSHREHSPHPTRRLRLAAAAAVLATLTAVSAYAVHSSGSSEAAQPKSVVEATPPPAPPKVLVPSAEQLAQQASNSTERTIILGPYDPETESGTIGYVAENDAVRLGYTNLTREQNIVLIDRYLQYMDSRFPGGMSRERAYRLPDDAALPYPSMNTVRAWIGEMLTGAGENVAASPDVPQLAVAATVKGAQQAQYGHTAAMTGPTIGNQDVVGSAQRHGTSILPRPNELRQDTGSSVWALPVAVPRLIIRSFVAHKQAFTRDTDPKMLRGLFASGRALRDALTGSKR